MYTKCPLFEPYSTNCALMIWTLYFWFNKNWFLGESALSEASRRGRGEGYHDCIINQSINLSIYLPIHPSISLMEKKRRISWLINQSINQSINISIYPSIHPSISLMEKRRRICVMYSHSSNQSIHQSIYPFIHQSISLTEKGIRISWLNNVQSF